MTLADVGVVGAGLIGTSAALALTGAGRRVWLHDRDEAQLAVALALGAGDRYVAGARAEHVLIAVPPSQVAAVLLGAQQQNLGQTYSDAASVKSQPLVDAEKLGCDMSLVVGGHPIAGRERGGAAAAREDLFRDRLWVLCPVPSTARPALAAARDVAEACGAHVVETTAERHDRALALLSHVPQLVASALAARLEELDEEDLRLAGQGFREVTRLADSPPELWAEIITGNATEVRVVLRAVLDDLAGLIRRSDVSAATRDLVAGGRTQRQRLRDKPGGASRGWTWLGVVVPDRAGELARLLTAVAALGTNVEDVKVEHSANARSGIAEIAVTPAAAQLLEAELASQGWTVYQRQ